MEGPVAGPIPRTLNASPVRLAADRTDQTLAGGDRLVDALYDVPRRRIGEADARHPHGADQVAPAPVCGPLHGPAHDGTQGAGGIRLYGYMHGRE